MYFFLYPLKEHEKITKEDVDQVVLPSVYYVTQGAVCVYTYYIIYEDYNIVQYLGYSISAQPC